MSRAFVIALREEVSHVEQINGCPILFSGVGKINAALAAYDLIHKGFTEIINIGSCGSKKYPLGEIIKVGKVYQDIDATPISPYGLTPFEEESHFIELDSTSDHSCFTTDYFYDHLQLEKYSPAYVEMVKKSSVFDMELYGIAKACKRFNVKLTAYKWVSDDGDFSKWAENCEISSRHVIEMLAAQSSNV
jgi:adenosylhomocysteine nucleosidase